MAIQSDVESKGESKSVSSSTGRFFDQNSEKDLDVDKCTQINSHDQTFNFDICNTSFDSLLSQQTCKHLFSSTFCRESTLGTHDHGSVSPQVNPR